MDDNAPVRGDGSVPAGHGDPLFDHIGRRLRTLEECALHKRTLRLTCPRCHHIRILDAVPLWWLFHRRGWDGAIAAARERMRCAHCAKGGGPPVRPGIAIVRDPPTGEQLPSPDVVTWKKLVSRYRS